MVNLFIEYGIAETRIISLDHHAQLTAQKLQHFCVDLSVQSEQLAYWRGRCDIFGGCFRWNVGEKLVVNLLTNGDWNSQKGPHG